MSVSLLLGLVYFISELLLTVTRRSRSRTGTKQDRSTSRVVWLVIIVSVAAGIYVAKHWPAAALPYHRSFVFAALEYDLILDDVSRPTHDASTPDGRKVQIKAT